MSFWTRLLGRDQAMAYGALNVVVHYRDRDGSDGDASGNGHLNVAPEGLIWKIDGYQPGNRDWGDIESWHQVDHAAGESQLLIVFDGRLEISGSLADVRITVSLATSTREIARLTSHARRYLATEQIVVESPAKPD